MGAIWFSSQLTDRSSEASRRHVPSTSKENWAVKRRSHPPRRLGVLIPREDNTRSETRLTQIRAQMQNQVKSEWKSKVMRSF